LVPADVGEDGRFGYGDLSRYWREPGHHAFLARVEGKLAGFALVRRMAEPRGDVPTWDIAEFFVLRRYRRRGVGAELAEAIWNLHCGNWKVRVRGNNLAGLSFWESAIARFTGRPAVPQGFVVEEVAWHLFSFQSPG
jgi:predicted acetyltransferase